MATHYVEPGTVPIVVGAVYSRYPANSNYLLYSMYRCTLLNDGTQTAKLVGMGFSKHVTYVSFAELSSRWHLIRRQ
jgi:hypothetical protein